MKTPPDVFLPAEGPTALLLARVLGPNVPLSHRSKCQAGLRIESQNVLGGKGP